MRKLFSLYRYILLFCLTIALVGCGFHLRGDISLPPELHTFYLTGTSPYSSLVRQIRQVLKASHITLVDSAEKAPVTLYVLSDKLGTSQTTIGSSGTLRDYNVTYTVSYTLLDPAGNILVGPLSVSASETITALDNELLENSNKLNQAKRSLQQDVIIKMIFQISAKNTVKVLSQAAKKHKPVRHRKKTSKQTSKKSHEAAKQ